MTITAQQAAGALHDLEKIQSRSAVLYGYRRASPWLILWGLLWVVGYGLNDLFPALAKWIWVVVDLAGIVAGPFLLRMDSSVSRASIGLIWRYVAVSATLFAFICLSVILFRPVTGRQVAAFIPLIVATVYVLWGIWKGPRYIIAGVAIAGLTLIGFFALPQHFFLWMAVVGGGALVLAGLWVRRV